MNKTPAVWDTDTGLDKYNDTANIAIMKENTKYFTVPIGMLKGLISGERDMMECASDIIDYSLYYHAVRLPFTSECNEITTQLKASAEFFNVRLLSKLY